MQPSDVNKSAGNKWKLYEYLVQVSVLFKGEKPLELSQAQIYEIIIEKDFDNDHMPVFILRLMIPQTLADNIWDKDPDVTVRLDGYEKLPDKDIDMERVTKKLYFNEVFKVVPRNDDPTYNTTIRKRIRSLSGYKENEMTIDDLGGVFNFILVKKNCLYDAKTISNMVLHDVNLTSALKALFREAKCKNVLMSNLDNMTVYDELGIFPMTFLSNVIYLEQQYGFHKEGTQVFMDFDTFYVLRMSGKATAWRLMEQKKGVFCISETSSSGIVSNGGVVTPTEIIMNVDSRQYISPTSSPIIDSTIGTNTLLVNETTTEYSDVKTNLGSNYNVKSTQGHNPYVEHQIKLRTQEAIKTRQLFCTSINLATITPNKEYRLVSDITSLTKELAGSYRLSKISTTFMKEGVKFTGTSNITLKGDI